MQPRGVNGTSPRIEKFPALASAMGVSVDWLLTGRGDKRRPVVDVVAGRREVPRGCLFGEDG